MHCTCTSGVYHNHASIFQQLKEAIHMTSGVFAWILHADNSQLKVLDSGWSMKLPCGRASAAKVPGEGN